jgi:hypothetical protein
MSIADPVAVSYAMSAAESRSIPRTIDASSSALSLVAWSPSGLMFAPGRF